jgi:hypothetical protein
MEPTPENRRLGRSNIAEQQATRIPSAASVEVTTRLHPCQGPRPGQRPPRQRPPRHTPLARARAGERQEHSEAPTAYGDRCSAPAMG